MAGIIHLCITGSTHKAWEPKSLTYPGEAQPGQGWLLQSCHSSQEGTASSIIEFAWAKTAKARHQLLFFCPRLTFSSLLVDSAVTGIFKALYPSTLLIDDRANSRVQPATFSESGQVEEQPSQKVGRKRQSANKYAVKKTQKQPYVLIFFLFPRLSIVPLSLFCLFNSFNNLIELHRESKLLFKLSMQVNG